MNITIAKNALWRELAYLQQYVLDKKGHIPALSHIRLEASGPRRLTLAGTDLDVTLTCETEATVSQAGVCALPGRKLFDIVKNLPDAPVTLTVKAHCRADITCGRSQFKVAGLPAEDFPALPAFQEASARLPANVAQTLIARTRFAITQEESRYTLSGAQFTLSPQGARMVATDGHRLALAENRAATSEQSLSCLIPKKALGALAQLAAGHEGVIGLHASANQLSAEIGPRTLVCRLLAGEFPDYTKIIPSQMAHRVEFACDELLQTVRRVAVMAQDRVRGLCLEFRPGQLRVYTHEDEQGAAEETLAANYDGPPVTVGMNAQYLSDYLSVTGGGSLHFGFNAPNAVVQLSPLGDAGCNSFALIMPLAVPQPVAAQDETYEATPEAEENEAFAEAA